MKAFALYRYWIIFPLPLMLLLEAIYEAKRIGCKRFSIKVVEFTSIFIYIERTVPLRAVIAYNY